MDKITIRGETRFFDGIEGFLWLLEKELGYDAHDYLERYLNDWQYDTERCVGECDRTYQLQEHYERIIQDAIEELQELTVPRAQEKKKNTLYQVLHGGLNPARYVPPDCMLKSVAEAVKKLEKCRDKDFMNYEKSAGEIGRVDISAFVDALRLLKGLL